MILKLSPGLRADHRIDLAERVRLAGKPPVRLLSGIDLRADPRTDLGERVRRVVKLLRINHLKDLRKRTRQVVKLLLNN